MTSGNTTTIKLKDATTLGQRVYGTSIGTTYRVIALNPRVKVACNIKGSEVSLRVECVSPTSQELEAVKTALIWKGSYGSKHLLTGSVPVYRVLGALLFSMEVSFDQMVHGKNELEKAHGQF